MWCRLIADVVGVPVVRSADTEVGAKGAFLSALVATGREPDLARAAARYVRTDRACAPDPEQAAYYTAAYQRFLELREAATAGWHSRSTTMHKATHDTHG
jgi:xylulokinase